jgi:hypothetical protein
VRSKWAFKSDLRLTALVVGAVLVSAASPARACALVACRADDETACPIETQPDAQVIPVNQSAPMTRMLEPPTAVQALGTALPDQTDEVEAPRPLPADQQRLPPGPPSRLP